MRVGLPVDIPPFRAEKDEERAFQRLEVLDPEAQERVISAIRE
jgi:hypothetical protein